MIIDEENITEIITKIRITHQIIVDQRSINLTDYLIELFQSIEQQQNINLSKLFSLLTNLLREYNDRAALKIEFIQGKCLETISHILSNQINNEENIISILEFISELIVNSKNVQEIFLDFDGYKKIFHFLQYVHSPSMVFINQLLYLMTDKSVFQIDKTLTPVDIYVQLTNPHIVSILIYWILYLNKQTDQHHIIHSLHIILSRSVQNKMIACSHDIPYTLIDILYSNKLNDKILLDNIFSILEKLSRFSINSKEIYHIFQLFNENTPYKKQLLRILTTAAKHDDPDTQSISSYFDLQQNNSGIILPIVRHWPSISSSSLHLTFHCWLRLNHETDSYPYNARRQIYSFYSDTIGLESFLCNSSLYILVNDRHELAYTEISECDEILDGCWHSLTIVHTAQRPSLLVAAFQSVSTCCLTVYIDGLVKKQIKDFKYVSLVNETMNFGSIGSPRQRSNSSQSNSKSDSSYLLTPIVKTMKPLRGLFSSKAKNTNVRRENIIGHSQNIVIVDANSQDTLFGESTCLHGQLSSIWILVETLNENQVKYLHSLGADFCHKNDSVQFDENGSNSFLNDYISNRSLILYHPLACNGQICVDISTCLSDMTGRLNNGSCIRIHSFAESLYRLGGCSILYPLIQKFNENEFKTDNNIDKNESLVNIDQSNDWIIVRHETQKNLSDIDNRVISNPIASIINLIRCVLLSKSNEILIDQMTKHYNVELLSKHLNTISSSFIDQQLLISIQQLIEYCRFNVPSNLLTNQLIQYVLFDFNLWNKSKFSIRMSHLQYISVIIKDERKFYRAKFGVQFFLDIIKQYFNSSSEELIDEEKQLRSAIYGIIKYYIQRHIHLDELNSLISTISTLSTSSNLITCELLEFILSLIDPPTISTDITINLLCQPNIIENLYSLLIVKQLSCKTKEIILKIIKSLVQSRKVSQQIKTQLKLETNQIGFGGIVSGLTSNELSLPIIREFLNLIITPDSTVNVDQLNIFLTLCGAASLDIRYVTLRKLMTCFIAHPHIGHSFVKCNGWQETVTHFFIKSKRSMSNESFNETKSPKGQSIDSGQESLNSENVLKPKIFEISSSPDDPSKVQQIRRIDLSPIEDDTNFIQTNSFTQESSPMNANLTPNSFLEENKSITPEYIQRNSDDFNLNDTEKMKTSPRSSSASREDLLSLIKTENSTDDITSMTSANDAFTSSQIMNPTSIKILFDDSEQGNEQNIRFSIKLRQILGVTSLEDSSLLNRSSTDLEDAGLLEEFCETLILTIVMILWKGVNGSDEKSWTMRGEVFSSLKYLSQQHDFYLPLSYIERRILELSIETCLNEIKLNGEYFDYDRLYRRHSIEIRKTTPSYENNCRELLKLVDDYLSKSNEKNEYITDNFVKNIFSMLDTMLIFEDNGINNNEKTSKLISDNEHWTETSLIGLNILLYFLSNSNVKYCGEASVRIHSLLHSRSINGREEASYLLSNINKIFFSITGDQNDEQFVYLLPIMKTIIDKSYEILQMNVQIPNVPLYKATATALEDFYKYCLESENNEWKMFIEKHIEPFAENYRSMSIKPFHMNMKIWWNNCHEMNMVGIHVRNRQIGEEKLKFQNFIVEQWRTFRRNDHHRLLKLAKQRRIHQVHVENEWKDREKYIYGERGPWCNKNQIKERYWMLSDRENIHRMRFKLIENDYFNNHEDASRLRDNLGINSTNQINTFSLEESFKNKNLLIPRENLENNFIDEQELLNFTTQTQSLLLEEKEKMIIGTDCLLITSTSKTDGKLEITNKYIYFFVTTPSKFSQNDFKYPLSWLQDVKPRRYNLRPTALEFFLLNQINFLINFDKKVHREIYQKILSLKLPGLKTIYLNSSSITTPKEILKQSKLTEKWITREISNFDYLMMLNTIAGRTYNDLNQYPIFPWVLKDYTSTVLDLNDANSFRDFSKPIGIQNPKHIEMVKSKYESFDDPTGLMKKFHYGTHYSNAATVIHYLIRMEPFTTLHIELQSGKFDIADRQFHSFESAWLNIMDSPNDGKELIPEFFYLPEFLMNLNQFDLGKLQISHQLINDVQLPPWANGSAEEFVHLHRLALESDYVSVNLHQWIDLIFGYKQTGQAAIDALNVYMYCSYENAVDLDSIDDPVTRQAIEGMIQNFGQIPSQLFTEPHPQRQTKQQFLSNIDAQTRSLNICHHLTHIRAFFVEITPSIEKLCDPITFISIPKNQIRSFMQQGISDTLITISVNGVVGNNGWQPYDKSLSNYFTFERDPTLQTERNRHIIAAPFSPSVEINSRLFAVSHDAKYVFSGGHWDNSLRIYSLLKSKMIFSKVAHNDIITCLTLDSTGFFLVTGSRDTTCIIWNILLNDNQNNNEQQLNSFASISVILYGHTSEITCLAVSTELDLVLSGSLDGTCNIHTAEHGTYIRTLRPNNGPIVNLKLSNERYIVIQTEDKETSLLLFSINGYLIRTKRLEYRVVDMILTDEHIALAVNHTSVSNKSLNNSQSAARIVIKDMFEMKTIQSIRLRTQINCLYFTKDFSHLLAGVKDGKLIVLTAETNSPSKGNTKNSSIH